VFHFVSENLRSTLDRVTRSLPKPRMPRVVYLVFLLGLIAQSSQGQKQPPTHFLIGGTLVTPDGVIAHGWLDVDKGRILHLERSKPEIPGVLAVETEDLIFAGFIDLHNHPGFNVFPRWTPQHTFPDRYAWRDWHVYQKQMETRGYALQGDKSAFCDIDEYAEVKALIGGATSMIGMGADHQGHPGQSSPDCIRGLVRNLDHFTGFYGTELEQERVANSIGILPRDMNANTAARYAQEIREGSLDLLAIHIAEGLPTDAESSQELDMLEARGLLGPHTALIHAVGLSPSQLGRVARAGASIVWSPHSNFVLYGTTANVDAAFREGVTISLAPDWSPTGSDNMWEEIQYAHGVSERELNGLFSNRQLVEMASSVPARVARIDDKVGTLATGMLADFFLVKPLSAGANPYDAIVEGDIASSMDMVMIDGVPVYGAPELLERFGVALEPLTICGREKALNRAALPAGSFAEVSARLDKRMKALGTELASLDECGR